MAGRKVRFRGICHPPASPEDYDGHLLRISDMKKQLDKMEGAPVMVDHGDEKGEFYQCYKDNSIGTILKGWIDEKNRLIVEFETDRSDPRGARAERDIKSGTLTSLSLGIGHVIGQNIKDPLDFKVIAKDIHEVSATKDPALQDTIIYGVQPDSKDWKIKTNLIQKHLTDVKYQRSGRQKRRGNMGDSAPTKTDTGTLTNNATSPDTGQGQEQERERDNTPTKRSRDESPNASGETISTADLQEYMTSRPEFQQFMDEKKKREEEEKNQREGREREERDYYIKKAPDMVNYLTALADLGKDGEAGTPNQLMENPQILDDWRDIVENAPKSEDWKDFRPMLSVISQASEHSKATVGKLEGAYQKMKEENEEYKKQLEDQVVESKKRKTIQEVTDRWGGVKSSGGDGSNNPYDLRHLSQRLGSFDRRWTPSSEQGNARSSQSVIGQPESSPSPRASENDNLDVHPATQALNILYEGKKPPPLVGGDGIFLWNSRRQIPRMSGSSLRQADVPTEIYDQRVTD